MQRSIEEFTVTTTSDEDGIEVTGASIEEEELAAVLRAKGVIHVRNQDGALIELMLDMDEESLIATPAEDQSQ
jgi:hypothetical protein